MPRSGNSGNKGGQTSSGAAKAGAKERPAATSSRSASGAKSYKDTASGKTYAAPKFSGASVKGLTSKDPANVARNRAGAAKYSSVKDRIASSNRDGNADKAAARMSARPRPATAPVSKVAPPTTAPKPTTTMATRPPAGYRPGIDPEFNYSAGAAAPTPRPAMAPRPAVAAMAAPRVRVQPTITLAKGGKAPRKK